MTDGDTDSSRDWRGYATVAVVLLLLVSQPGAVLAQTLTHSATAGTTYVTNSGLEVTLGEQRDVDSVPFADDETFADGDVRLSAPSSAAATINNDTYGGDTMTVGQIDATSNPLTVRRTDGLGPVTVSGGATSLIVSNISLDDNTTDFELSAASTTNVTVNVPTDIDGVQAVDSTGTPIAGDQNTGDGTAKLTFDAGTYEVRLQDGPSTLEIRDIQTQELITETANGTAINVEVQFFGDEGAVTVRNTTNGTIDMSGLPIDERFSVSIDAGDEYVQRQILIPSLLEQRTAWLLNQSVDVDTVEPRFTLVDPSNQFDTQESEIVLERPIEINGTTEFEPVAGDRIGINGFDTILERDQRYRVVVRDPESGSVRRLGEFVPTQSEQVTLEVQDVEFDSEAEVEGLEWTARYVESDAGDEIEFIFRDEFETQSLTYEIHERGNESNILASGSASGNVTIAEPVPPGETNTVWEVSWQATRGNGEELSATRPVSTDNLPVGPSQLPQQWQIIISMLALFGVAGLFGAANPGLGGIAVAGVGGFFFMIGWLPDATGGIMVMLAMLIAVLSYAGRRARGATA
jgi:hypothetical protein